LTRLLLAFADLPLLPGFLGVSPLFTPSELSMEKGSGFLFKNPGRGPLDERGATLIFVNSNFSPNRRYLIAYLRIAERHPPKFPNYIVTSIFSIGREGIETIILEKGIFFVKTNPTAPFPFPDAFQTLF